MILWNKLLSLTKSEGEVDCLDFSVGGDRLVLGEELFLYDEFSFWLDNGETLSSFEVLFAKARWRLFTKPFSSAQNEINTPINKLEL